MFSQKEEFFSIFDEQCCTYIPDQSGPDGELNDILHKMHDLSAQMHEGAGVDTSAFQWFHDMFGSWKHLLIQGTIRLLIAMVVSGLLFCCCIPCLRSLVTQMIMKQCDTVGQQVLLLNMDGSLTKQLHNQLQDISEPRDNEMDMDKAICADANSSFDWQLMS